MMTFKLMRQNQRWLWHVNVCCISQGSIKTPFRGDRWFWCHFVTHLLGYMRTNNYSNRERFDKKVIAERKWCSFFAPQCRFISSIHYSILMKVKNVPKSGPFLKVYSITGVYNDVGMCSMHQNVQLFIRSKINTVFWMSPCSNMLCISSEQPYYSKMRINLR